jgi:hypothetical protein
MTASIKQKVYKCINVGVVLAFLALLGTTYGYFYTEQKTQAKDIVTVREEVVILKQSPLATYVVSNDRLLEIQRMQIDINTRHLAVLDVQYKGLNEKMDIQYKAIDNKLTMIQDLVRDNNVAIYERKNKEK